MKYDLYIAHDGSLYKSCVEEGVTLSLERKGSPGKLSFRMADDGVLLVSEGDQVQLTVDGVQVF